MATYQPIASITLGSSADSVTFSSIPQTYRDLVLVFDGKGSLGGGGFWVRANNDSSNSYHILKAEGNGSSTSSVSLSPRGQFDLGAVGVDQGNTIVQFMDYSATDKHKTALSRNNDANQKVVMTANRYSSTSAISELIVLPQNGDWVAGSTFALYGIEA